MEAVLEALAACSMMDVIGILKKKRKTVVALTASVGADRAESHPKVFTSITISYLLESPDSSLADLEKAVSLSLGTYCSVSAMLKQGGCSNHIDSDNHVNHNPFRFGYGKNP